MSQLEYINFLSIDFLEKLGVVAPTEEQIQIVEQAMLTAASSQSSQLMRTGS